MLPWLLNVILSSTCWFWRLERNLASILIRCFILVLRSPINWRKRRQGLLHWIQYGLQSSYIKALIIHSSHFGRRPNQVFGWLRTTFSWNWNFRRRSFVYVRAPTDTGSTQRTEQVSVIVVSNVDFWLFDLQLIANSSPTASLLPSAAALRTGSIESVCFNR